MPSSRSLLLVLLVSLVVRGGILWAHFDELSADPDNYLALAQNLWTHHTLGFGERPSAFRPPLYPLLLAPVVALAGNAGIAALHLALGLATVALTFILAREAQLGRYAPAAAALLVAIDPILLVQSTKVMTETLATFAAVSALYALSRAADRSASAFALAGAALGLAALARPTFLAWAALVIVAIPLMSGSSLQRATRALACLVGVGLALAPWMIRNRLEFGRWIAGTTHGGYTLLLANNPDYYDFVARGEWGAAWDAHAFNDAVTPLLRRRTPDDEVASNARAYEMAWSNIRRQPRRFAQATIARVASLWNFLPHRLRSDEPVTTTTARYLIGAYYLAVYAGALFGCAQRPLHRSPWLWIVLLVLALTATHALYWSDLRMRSVAMPGVALLTAASLAPLAKLLATRANRPPSAT